MIYIDNCIIHYLNYITPGFRFAAASLGPAVSQCVCDKRISFLNFSVICLSRACLGKKIVLKFNDIMKILHENDFDRALKSRFSHRLWDLAFHSRASRLSWACLGKMFSSFCFLRRYKKAFFPTCAIAWSSAAVFLLQETPFLVQFLALQIALMLVSRAVLERKSIYGQKRQSPFFSRFWNKATRRKLTPPAFETKCFGQQNPAKKEKKRQWQF